MRGTAAVAVAAAAVLAGCSSGGGSKPAPATPQTQTTAPGAATAQPRSGDTILLLTPRPDAGGARPGTDVLARTADVLRQRFTGAGFVATQVSVEGGNVAVRLPGGTSLSAAGSLLVPGQLAIREVATGCTTAAKDADGGGSNCVADDPSLLAASASPAPSALPTLPAFSAGGAVSPLPSGTGPITWTEAQARAAFPALRCATDAVRLRVADFAPPSWALGCGTTASPRAYLLMPAAVTSTDVTSASVEQLPATSGGEPAVDLAFRDDAFTRLTAGTVGGTLQNAVVLDGIVVSAPTNQAPIPGDAQLTGSFTQATAAQLAAVLNAGPLPVTFGSVATERVP